jgi:hypothetical protein
MKIDMHLMEGYFVSKRPLRLGLLHVIYVDVLFCNLRAKCDSM